MTYSIWFDDKKLIYTSEWIDGIKIKIRLEINDKIVINEDSFQSNIFIEENEQSRLKVIEELNSIADTLDTVSGPLSIGCYTFVISDITYWASANGKSTGCIVLKKLPNETHNNTDRP